MFHAEGMNFQLHVKKKKKSEKNNNFPTSGRYIPEGYWRGFHWKPRVVIMPTLSPLVAPGVVIMTTYGATSGDKVSVMTPTLSSPTAPEVVFMTTYDATGDDKVDIMTWFSWLWSFFYILTRSSETIYVFTPIFQGCFTGTWAPVRLL